MKDRPAIDAVLNQRAAAARRQFEVPVMVAALATIPVLIVELTTTGLWETLAILLDWLIWTAFAVEFAVVAFLTDNRRAYANSAWLDLLVIVLSFPPLGGLLALLRMLRLARLVRVLRLLRLPVLAIVADRGATLLHRLLRRRRFGLVTVTFLSVALLAGGLFALFEGHGLVDGLWWAVVTLTTVGYGDFSPVTTAGRVTAVILMLSGIGVVSFITASIAAVFVYSDQESDIATRLQAVEQREIRIEATLEQIRSHLANPSTESEGDPELSSEAHHP